MENVSSTQSGGDDGVHLRNVVMRYLENGSQIMESSKQSDRQHVAKVRPIGDVVHVFSHIRKTYRVSWAVLTGASGPPTLRALTEVQPALKKGTRAKKAAPVSASTDGGAISPPGAAWVKLSDVEHAKYVALPSRYLRRTHRHVVLERG